MAIVRALAAPILAAALAAMLAIPATAFADTRFPAYGAQGDVATDLKCPPEMYISAFAGNTGAWIDSIKIQCGRMTAEGRVGSDWSSPVLGGSGGGYNNTRCPDGMAVSAIDVTLTDDDRQVFSISPTCYGGFNGATGAPHGDRGNVFLAESGRRQAAASAYRIRLSKSPTRRPVLAENSPPVCRSAMASM